MSSLRWLIALSTATSLTGCAVGPAYIPPPAPTSASFHNAPLAAERAAAAPAPAADQWWAGFNDPELTRLVTLARAQNLDLAQAEARVAQARAQARLAGAALLPAAQLSAQGAFQSVSLNSPSGRIQRAFPGFNREQSLYDLNAGASWEADLFGGLHRGSQAARAQYQASLAARGDVLLTVEAETADSYVLVRTLQTRLAVVEQQAATQRRLLDLVRLQVARGLAPRRDADAAEGALTQTEAALPVLRAGLEAALNSLAVLTGTEPGGLHAELAAAAPIPRVPAIDSSGGPAALVRRRPDIIAAERTLAASNARIGAAISDYYPKLTFSGVLGFEAGNFSSLIGSAGFQPQGLVGLRWRLFDFGRVDAEVAAARGANAEALAAYRQSVLKATADVESALVSLVERERQAQTLEASEAALERARTAAEMAYKAGQVSLVEVLDADRQLLAVRDARVVARSEAARAGIASFRALGGGWSA